MNLNKTLDIEFIEPRTLTGADLDKWREISRSYPVSGPFMDDKWILSWISSFGPQNAIIAMVREEGDLKGVAPGYISKEKWAGKKVRVFRSAANVWSYRYEFLVEENREDILRFLFVGIMGDLGCDVACLEIIPQGSAMNRIAREPGAGSVYKTVTIPLYSSPWKTLSQTPSLWDEGLKSKFKSNLRNREKRLKNKGTVDFEVYKSGDDLDQALQVFYRLEESGWKGKENTAIISNKEPKALFDSLVNKAKDEIWIPILTLSGQPIAAHLIRIWGNTMFLLKTSYNPEYSAYSPGQLITARIIQYGIENGMKILDFLGENMSWKEDWNPELRANSTIVICGDSLIGRYIYWTKFGMRETLKKVPGAVKIANWIRKIGGTV